MTPITLPRATVEQALEALETCDAAHPSDGGQQWYDEKLVEPAITALRTALAQQAEPQSTHNSECWRWHHKCAVAKIERECKHD